MKYARRNSIWQYLFLASEGEDRMTEGTLRCPCPIDAVFPMLLCGGGTGPHLTVRAPVRL